MQKNKPKVYKDYIRYVLIDHRDNTATVYHYKKDISRVIGITVRTLTRNKVYSKGNFSMYTIKELKI
jgi:hypothetical protein